MMTDLLCDLCDADYVLTGFTLKLFVTLHCERRLVGETEFPKGFIFLKLERASNGFLKSFLKGFLKLFQRVSIYLNQDSSNEFLKAFSKGLKLLDTPCNQVSKGFIYKSLSNRSQEKYQRDFCCFEGNPNGFPIL